MTACMTGLDLDWSGRLVEVMDWRRSWTGGGGIMTACMTGLDLDWSGRLVEVMDWRRSWTGGGGIMTACMTGLEWKTGGGHGLVTVVL